jgi:hypothetical protein
MLIFKKKKMNNISKLIIIFLVCFIFNSCDKDYLNTGPTDQASSELGVETTKNSLVLLNGIHRSLYIRFESTQGNGGIGASFVSLDCMGEDHVVNANGWFNRVYQWTPGASDTDFYSRFPWIFYYHIVANANVLINGIDKAEGSVAEKNAIKGQALVYRAFAHYQLVQIYGGRYKADGVNTQLGVPYKFSNVDLTPARNTVEEVYGFINSDLDNATVLLLGSGRSDKSNINQAVAKGLKARVALTQGKWAVAAQMASEARVGFTLMSQSSYRAGFSVGSQANSEFMWASQIQPDQTDTFGNFGAFMSRNFSSSSIRSNPRSISSLLYNKISESDVRKSLWDPTGKHLSIGLPSNFQKFPYTSQKFIAAAIGDSRVDVPLMRSAEMYLIEAEAYARNGNNAAAANALFVLAKNRDGSYVQSSNTGQSLIDEIMIQRRVELWGEGFRFLDLKRLNQALDRRGANHNASLAGNVLEVPAGDVRWDWLIPIEEMNTNPNMVQNPL